MRVSYVLTYEKTTFGNALLGLKISQKSLFNKSPGIEPLPFVESGTHDNCVYDCLTINTSEPSLTTIGGAYHDDSST